MYRHALYAYPGVANGSPPQTVHNDRTVMVPRESVRGERLQGESGCIKEVPRWVYVPRPDWVRA